MPERRTALAPIRLSKSKYLSGLQCDKRLFLDIHHPALATAPDESTQALLAMGTEIGELARRRFPGGRLVAVDHRHSAEALARTAELLADPSVPAVYEGALQHDDVLVRVDILERVAAPPGRPDRWRLIEVKSSTRVKAVHLDDLAVQAYVMRGAGIEPAQVGLLHIDTGYVYPGGNLDLDRLFVLRDVTDAVLGKQGEVAERLARMKRVVTADAAPAIEPGSHCRQPYDCPFWDHCTKDKPDRWIFRLPGSDKTWRALLRQGIRTIDDIPDGFRLAPAQQRMKDNVEWISPRLKPLLESVRYPVHHLDFETFMPAIPKYAGTRPYQVLPTQWSNHIEFPNGEVAHHDYLCTDARDPREELAVRLLESVGEEGSICVYSDYEKTILLKLAELFPSLREDLIGIVGRLWDLLPIIQAHYYHPLFRGSYSIKTVLPAVIEGSGYADLDIRDGDVAARRFHRMVFEELNLVERAHAADQLRQYCARDTWAMVELRRALLRRHELRWGRG
jgi:hypothetical protein